MATIALASGRPEINYVDHPAFHDPEERQRILESTAAERAGGDADGKSSLVPVLEAVQEKTLFLQMNCLKFLAAQRRRHANALTSRRASLAAHRAADALEQSSREVRDRIVAANLRLVRATAARWVFERGPSGLAVQEDLVAEGNFVLLRAVEHFDVSYGFRFSTYATRALRREMARLVRKQAKHTQRMMSVPELEPICPETDNGPFEGEQLALVPEVLASLPEREREMVKRRYGFKGGKKTLSYRTLGVEFGVSPERVRQLVERSFASARKRFGRQLGMTS